jgi:hypothetical protein
MKQNNGFVNVSSVPGQGSTFRLYIPRAKGQAIEAPLVREAPTARGRGNILLVEDDDMVRELTRSMLQALGYTVMSAESARVALSLCESPDRKIDLLLSDLVMPDMKGPELRDRARLARPGLDVLFMTGYATASESLRGESVSVIQKPFTMAELGRQVETALRPPPRSPT